MKVAIVGGGPGGLFLAVLLRKANPDLAVTVFERNAADATFGFGVVFSDRTLNRIHEADPALRIALESFGVHWDDIEVRLKDEIVLCGGNGMAAVSRRQLLLILQERAIELGATLQVETEVGLADLKEFDLVVAADGSGSTLCAELADQIEPTTEQATARFIWLGTTYSFDGLTFIHERNEHGVFAVHGYPISDEVGTFIVETDEATWRAAGLDEFDTTQPPGLSDQKSLDYLETLFAGHLGDAKLLANNSRWGQFVTRRAARWSVLSPQPVVFLGDAVHTAHFSVGAGTKMAMEDAIELSAAVAHALPEDLPAALQAYENEARPAVDAIQNSAVPSLSWWEHFGLYHDTFEPWQFGYHFITRSMSDARLRRRAPEFADTALRAWKDRHTHEPLDTPLQAAQCQLDGRVVVETSTGDPAVSSSPAATAVLHGLSSVSDAQGGGRTATDAFGAVRVVGAQNDAETELNVESVLGELAASEIASDTPVIVGGERTFGRRLLAEQIRLRTDHVVILDEPDISADEALTAILSGRTDLVAIASCRAASWPA